MSKHLTLIIILLVCFLKIDAQIIKHDPNNYNQLFDQQKRNIIKINPLFPFLKNVDCSFERAISPRKSAEFLIGFVGIGLDGHNYRNFYQGTKDETSIKTISEGFFFSAGYKFFRLPRLLKRNPHILQGGYIKPELAIGFYNIYRFTSFTPPIGLSYTIPETKEKVNYKAFLVNFGSQKIIAEVVSLDLFLGIGFAVDNLPPVTNTFLYFGEEHPGIYKTTAGGSLAFKAGIKIGFLFR